MIFLANGLALVSNVYVDYLGKKYVEKDKLDGPVAMTTAIGTISFLLAMGLYAFGMGESGNTPWVILTQMPAVRWCAMCTAMYGLINLVAFRYIGITIENVTFSFASVFMLVGMVLIYLLSGKLGDVAALLQPLPLACIILTLLGVFLLPYVDEIGVPKERRMSRELDRLRNDRKKMLIGIVLIIASSAFDAGDSLITSVAFSEEEANSMDYSIAAFFAIFLLYMFIALALAVKRRRLVNVFRRGQGGTWLYALVYAFAGAAALWAMSLDAVRANSVWIIYPAIAILVGRILLKERFSRRQYVCMAVVLLCSLGFYL